MAINHGGTRNLAARSDSPHGTSDQTHAWNDNWLPRDMMLRPIACKKDNAPLMVADFIDASSASWNVSRLEEFFLPIDIEVIKSTPIGTSQFGLIRSREFGILWKRLVVYLF
jgi:hypothetical protein